MLSRDVLNRPMTHASLYIYINIIFNMYEFVTYVHVVGIFMYFLSFNLQKLGRNYAAGVFGVLCRLF